MSFKEVASLDTDKMVTIGGEDKSGKPNPTKIEGYFLGTKTLGPNKFNKSKNDHLHVLQTKDGNTGVWGKTNLDQKMAAVNPGTMVRITFTGTRDVGKGNDMLCYKVEADAENKIDVTGLTETREAAYHEVDESDDDDLDSDERALDEVPPARASAPRQAARPSSAAAVQDLLNRGRKASA